LSTGQITVYTSFPVSYNAALLIGCLWSLLTIMLKRWPLILFSILLCGSGANAQDFPIDAVVVEGNSRVDSATIASLLTVKAGTTVSAADIDRDVVALFKSARFVDVQVDYEERDGKQILVYRVVEQPLVRSLKFSGYDELGEDKLKAVVTQRTPSLYNPSAIDKSVGAMKKLYADEGFYAAAITTKFDVKMPENEGVLTFVVSEGEKVLIDSIRFEGNTVFASDDLLDKMETKEKFWLTSWITGRGAYQPEMLQRDLEVIADGYFDRGYVQIKLKQPQVNLIHDNEYLDVVIELSEGAQFRVGELDVKGDLLGRREELLALTRLKPGDIFSRKVLRDGVLAISDFYADQGYAYVNVSPLSSVDVEKRLINLVFEIEQGSQVHIDKIRLRGNVKTRDKVVRRELQVVEGDLYNASRLKESKRRVKNLGYFEEIQMTPAKGATADKMNLDIEVKEKPTGTFSLGFGYSSVDKIVGQGSVTQENWLGRGYKLNLSGAFGSSSTTYQVGITDPYFLDSKVSLGFDLYNTDREFSDYSKRAAGGALRAGYPLTPDGKTRIGLTYRYEQKEIYDVSPFASVNIISQEGYSTLSSISATLVRDTTDYRLDPSRGTLSSFSTEFAGIGGTEKFARFDLDGRYFHPLFWSTVFMAHGRIGYIAEVGGEPIPIDERYYLGGLNSLRGFESRTVGPRTEVPVGSGFFEYAGGNKAAYFNFEYLFPIVKEANIKGVLFFDIGNAWDESETYFSTMRRSVGAGIRWASPLGPLRLEWGYNLAPIAGEKSSELQFSIGSFF